MQHFATSFGSTSSLNPQLEIDLGRELVKCHFEATVHLQDWDGLVDVANVSVVFTFSPMDADRSQQCRLMKDQKLSQMVVDMTLSRTGEVPTATQLKILEACFSTRSPASHH